MNSGLPEGLDRRLVCPACRGSLRSEPERFVCASAGCGAAYPVVNGVPVLVNERTSVFSAEDIIAGRNTYGAHSGIAGRILRRLTPGVSLNTAARRNYLKFAELLLIRRDRPCVLVLGGAELGCGLESIIGNERLAFVETDVRFGPRTRLICDACAVPFADGTFDGVVAQAVLEHVCDAHRCVLEMHRVLRASGLVYAEVPFIQQVHAAQYDFTRFTLMGLRRLFRHFEEIDSGVTGGPGMALAWSWVYFLRSFGETRRARALLQAAGAWTAFYFKYFDSYLARRPAAVDAASGCYFLGWKSRAALDDRKLLKHYKGAFSPN